MHNPPLLPSHTAKRSMASQSGQPSSETNGVCVQRSILCTSESLTAGRPCLSYLAPCGNLGAGSQIPWAAQILNFIKYYCHRLDRWDVDTYISLRNALECGNCLPEIYDLAKLSWSIAATLLATLTPGSRKRRPRRAWVRFVALLLCAPEAPVSA